VVKKRKARNLDGNVSVTLQEIADACGVSLPTVSQILGQRTNFFNEKTRQKVFLAAKEMGYRRNVTATNLAAGKTNTLYIALHSRTSIATTHYVDAFFGFSKGGFANNQQVSLAIIEKDDVLADPMFNKLREQKICDGIVFNIFMDEEVIKNVEAELHKVALPTIWMNVNRPFNAVIPDDNSAVNEISKALLLNGHRHIIYIGTAGHRHYSVKLRRRELENCFLSSGGLSFRCIDEWSRLEELEIVLQDFFKNPGETTAFVLYSPGSLEALLQNAARMGRSFTDDFSFVLLDCPPTTYSAGSPRIKLEGTSVNFYEMGRVAIEMLLERIAQNGVDLPTRTVPLIYVPGATLKNISEKSVMPA
jgi:LacI family transcriptional regulator